MTEMLDAHSKVWGAVWATESLGLPSVLTQRHPDRKRGTRESRLWWVFERAIFYRRLISLNVAVLAIVVV